MTEDQAALLSALVEAHRRTPKEAREPFSTVRTAMSHNVIVLHAGLPQREIEAYPADLEELGALGFLRWTRAAGRSSFDITNDGLVAYQRAHRERDAPVDRVVAQLRSYVDAAPFRARFPGAFACWQRAEGLLWSADSTEQLTAIGHHCREAMQSFATELLAAFPTPAASTEPSLTKNRIRAVVSHHAILGSRRATAIGSLLDYWESIVDLTQRQEHGAVKEGDPLTWEDGRRVVLHALIVMSEVWIALSTQRP